MKKVANHPRFEKLHKSLVITHNEMYHFGYKRKIIPDILQDCEVVLIIIKTGNVYMSSLEIIEACQNLFSITSSLAHRILPSLRLEDIKIVLAKQLHKVRTETSTKKSVKKSVGSDFFINSHNILVDYIQKNNLDVILALECYKNIKPSGESYLYPISGMSKITSSKHNDILSKKDLFFRGNLPPRKLRLGTFLYYKGFISYYNVVESIAWQKDRRPLIGQMAMQIGHLSIENFARTIVFIKNGNCFGEMARKKNFLSEHVVGAIVKAQGKYDCRIGKYFVEKKILSHNKIFELNEEMIWHNNKYN